MPFVENDVRWVNHEIDQLNQSFEAYRREANPVNKLKKLRRIHAEFNRINDRMPPESIDACSNYNSQFHNQLYQDIKAEFRVLGVSSMQEDAIPDSPPDVLANMSYAQVQKMAAASSFVEMTAFFNNRKNQYTIQVLGKSGGNNSNFLLKSVRPPRVTYVLKVENRLGIPRHIDTHLRKHGLSNVLTPILAARQIGTNVGLQPVTRTVLLTTPCLGMDVASESRNHQGDDEALIDSAIDIYTQMADILGVMEANHCVFTDMKNSNWLRDEAGNLRISDTKGFLFTDAEGKLDRSDDALNGNHHRILKSWHTIPPEGWENKPDAAALHADMMGKNLYRFLTKYLGDESGGHLNFDAPVFKTERGKALESLIKRLTGSDPSQRPSAEVVSEQLHMLGEPPVRETKAVLHYVEAYEAFKAEVKSLQGEHMARLIQVMDEQMEKDTTPMAMSLRQEQLARILKKIADLPDKAENPAVFSAQYQALSRLILAENKCKVLMQEISTFELNMRGFKDVVMLDFLREKQLAIEAAETPEMMEVILKELDETLEILWSGDSQVDVLIKKVNGLIRDDGFRMQEKAERIKAVCMTLPLNERGKAVLENPTVKKAMEFQRHRLKMFEPSEQSEASTVASNSKFKATYQAQVQAQAQVKKDQAAAEEPEEVSEEGKKLPPVN